MPRLYIQDQSAASVKCCTNRSDVGGQNLSGKILGSGKIFVKIFRLLGRPCARPGKTLAGPLAFFHIRLSDRFRRDRLADKARQNDNRQDVG